MFDVGRSDNIIDCWHIVITISQGARVSIVQFHSSLHRAMALVAAGTELN